MRRLAALAFALLTACSSGGGETRSEFYDKCIQEGQSDRVCDCLDSFAQAGNNPYGSFDKLLNKCEKYG